MSDYDVIVIGAGIGGLCAGALLAHQGRKVLVLEQAERVGGCCSTYEWNGYKIDIGASIIEFPQVINWAFERMGTTFQKEVDLIAVDPTFTARLHDGTEITFPIDLDKTKEEIRKLAPEDVRGWENYSKEMDGFLKAALDGFFVTPARSLWDVCKLFAKTPALLKYGSLFFGSYEGVLRKYLKNEKLLEALSFHSFYCGLPPALLPGHFSMIPYAEHTGIYYARGGMIGIPLGFQKCGERKGMEVRLNAAVEKVIVENRTVKAVRLSDGAVISAKIIVSDINCKKLYMDMIDQDNLSWLARTGYKSYRYSMATPMIYLCLDYTPPLKDHHTLMTVPMQQMNDYWFDHYEKGEFPAEQFGILSWTTRSDPSLAPAGHHIIAVTLAPGPYRIKGTTWDKEKETIKHNVIKYLESKYLPGLRDHIVHADFSTPVDFEKRLKSPEGAIYALRQDLTNAMMFRPSAKSKQIKGLYLVGASTHPGGGVPTVTASAMIAADLIGKYES